MSMKLKYIKRAQRASRLGKLCGNACQRWRVRSSGAATSYDAQRSTIYGWCVGGWRYNDYIDDDMVVLMM